MGKHLVFYDGACGLCDRTVQFLLNADQNAKFDFAPLQGKTAAEMLKALPAEYKQLDSLVLIENYQTQSPKIYVMSKAIFRILWLIGGFWKLVGWLCYLPSFLGDIGYRFVARHRHKFFGSEVCRLPDAAHKSRFLD